jgi:hypothetical protein
MPGYVGTPIFDELAAKRGIHIPYPLESDPVHALLAATTGRPALASLDVTQWLPVIRPTAIDPDRMPAEHGHAHGLDEEAS